jgi:hypothetical protein
VRVRGDYGTFDANTTGLRSNLTDLTAESETSAGAILSGAGREDGISNNVQFYVPKTCPPIETVYR